MIKEIYCRMPTDQNYLKNGDGKLIECQTVEENLLQRIRICLGTKKGDVLGDPDFGIDLEDYIFDMSVNEQEIEDDINLYLSTYVIYGYEKYYAVSCEVKFGKAWNEDEKFPSGPSDYLIIDILLNGQKAVGIIVT